MSKFVRNTFEQKFRILRFDIDEKYNKEIKEFCDFHRKRGSDRGSYFYDLRSELKGKQYREFLDVLIKSLIETYSKDTLIDNSEKAIVFGIFNNYSASFIEQEKSHILRNLASRGIQSNTSVAEATINKTESNFNKITLYATAKLNETIEAHNKMIVTKAEENKDRSNQNHNRTDAIISRIKNHKILSTLIVIGIIVIAVGQVTDSFNIIMHVFQNKNQSVVEHEQPLSAVFKVVNKFDSVFELNELCEYKIMESNIAMINILSQGRLHLIPRIEEKNNNFKLKPEETKEYLVKFPNSDIYSNLLARGSANIHFVLRSADLEESFICSAPFDRISLQKYFIECNIDTLVIEN